MHNIFFGFIFQQVLVFVINPATVNRSSQDLKNNFSTSRNKSRAFFRYKVNKICCSSNKQKMISRKDIIEDKQFSKLVSLEQDGFVSAFKIFN